MLNLAALLENSTREHPDKTAVVFGPTRLTFKQLDEQACQVANGLEAAGIRRGEKVAITCPNLPWFPIAYYGILKMGGVVVPLNVLLKSREIEYHLTDSDAAAYLCFEGSEALPAAEESRAAFNEAGLCRRFWLMRKEPHGDSPIQDSETWAELIQDQPTTFDTVQTRADDTCVILYTSGTTGRPKGAELTNSNMVMNAMVSRDITGGTQDDVTLVVLPLFHSFGQTCQMNAGILMGATVVLAPRFEPGEVLRLFEDEGVSFFAGVPTMYWELLNYPEADKFDLDKIASTLRATNSGGAAMPVEVMRQFEQKFGVTVLEGFGLSETAPVATCNRLDKLRKPGSIGLPVWGIELRIVDEKMNDMPVGEPGEIVIRGHNIMKGYYNKPEATEEAFRGGWFHTGDIGKTDEDGYFYVVGRLKDMIIRNGFNVYPRELEEVLITHPDISLVAVIGVPDEKCGEEIKAFVMLKTGATLTSDEIIAWSKKEMAAYKYPRLVEFRPSLPLGATGKILKTELRKQEAERMAASQARA